VSVRLINLLKFALDVLIIELYLGTKPPTLLARQQCGPQSYCSRDGQEWYLCPLWGIEPLSVSLPHRSEAIELTELSRLIMLTYEETASLVWYVE
jgi:hypothetical protein